MSCSSLFAQPTLVKQIKFPRHILPLAVVATNIVTLVAMLAVVVFFNLIFIPETRTTFWVAIPLLVPLIALASGLGVVFGYLTVVYRDIEHLMTTVFLPWFFITPIFFTLDQLPGLEGNEWIADVLYYVNFVAPFVEAIRDPLFFGEWPAARRCRLRRGRRSRRRSRSALSRRGGSTIRSRRRSRVLR